MENEQLTSVIYALCDPQTDTVRYVGKSNDPAARYRRHLKNARDGHQFHLPTWIRSLLAVEQKPKLLILETCPRGQWKEREIYWIDFYRAAGNDLTNCKGGGDGSEVTEETRLKMRAAKLGKPAHNKGQRASDEARQRQSEAAKVRWQRDSTGMRQALRKATEVSRLNRTGRPGRKKSAEEIEKIRQAALAQPRISGYKQTAEQRRRSSESKIGHPVSDETRRKIGDAVRKRMAEKKLNSK